MLEVTPKNWYASSFEETAPVTSSASPRRVLIIDDNVDLAENIAEILRMDGHATQVAASAEEAFPKVLAADPDVVVTDYRLPGVSGADLLKRLRTTWSRFFGVVISAYTDDRTIREARDVGATFLAKPVDFLLLSRLVRELHT